jgi:hypothetical protein
MDTLHDKKMDSEFFLYSYIGYMDVSCGRGVCVVPEKNSMRLGFRFYDK